MPVYSAAWIPAVISTVGPGAPPVMATYGHWYFWSPASPSKVSSPEARPAAAGSGTGPSAVAIAGRYTWLGPCQHDDPPLAREPLACTSVGRSSSRARRAGRDVPPPGRAREGLRDLHARPGRPRDELERWRRADQGLPRRRDHRQALLDLLHARRCEARPSARGPAGGRARGTLRGGGLACPQGRVPLL